MSYSYFPGCSLHSTGLEYGLSTRAVFDHLGLELNELPDWNCCGASSAHALDHELSLSLPARILALAQDREADLVTPCAACFNRLKSTDAALRSDIQVRLRVEQVVGFTFSGNIAIRPVLGVLHEDVGLAKIASHVRHPLSRLKVVTYYGCLLVRPAHITQFDDPDNPQIMKDLLLACGATVLPWSNATDCCGGSLSLSRSDIVQNLVNKLVERAREAGADAIATACPLCQVNLEMRQTLPERMPVFYFTELLGLAFGLAQAKKWMAKHLIDPRPLLKETSLLEVRG